MNKFLNVKDDYILKYAYYREHIAGTKYLDLNFDNLKLNYLEASSIATETATEAPTIGLLPIPINPIIST